MFAKIELAHFLHVVLHHDVDKLLEACLLRVPAQHALRLGRVAQELVHLCGTEVLGVNLDEDFARLHVNTLLVHAFAFPAEFDAHLLEGQRSKLAHRVILPGSNHKVLGLLLLEDEPHTLHIVLGITPVAKTVQVAQIQLVLEALGDSGGGKGNLARHEGLATAFALVVEQDAVAAEHIVTLTVVLHNPEAVKLRHTVGAAGVEGRRLLLRNLLHESVQLGGRGLIDAALVGQTRDAHRLQQAQHAHGVGIGRELGHVEAHLHVALCRQVIDLVRLDFADDADEAGGVGHVAPVQVHQTLLLHVAHPLVQVQVLDAARVERAAAT